MRQRMRRRAATLWGYLAIVLALTLVFWLMPRSVKELMDPFILVALTLGFAAACGVMLAATRSWTARRIGVFGLMAGAAVLYVSLLIGFWPRFEDWEWALRDVARACFVVALPRFVFGLLHYGDEADGLARERGR